jgi:hypothetical protein
MSPPEKADDKKGSDGSSSSENKIPSPNEKLENVEEEQRK